MPASPFAAGRRAGTAELIDQADFSFAEFDDCLRSLARINRLTLAYRPTLRWLAGAVAGQPAGSAPLSLLDVGSGGGDMLRRLRVWSRRHRVALTLTGIDRHDWATRSAEQATPAGAEIQYRTADVFAQSGEVRPDFIISSLFTHHLDDGEVIAFIRWMDGHARRGWFINDLHRHPLPYAVIRLIVPWLSRNRLIRHDAPVSVARAFTADEWRALLDAAGIAPERRQVRWMFPFRYGVACRSA